MHFKTIRKFTKTNFIYSENEYEIYVYIRTGEKHETSFIDQFVHPVGGEGMG